VDGQLRVELEPNMDEAERLYPRVLARMTQLMREVDEHGDGGPASERAAEDIRRLTSKTVEPSELLYAWESEGEEVLAFRLSLPDPPVVEDISYAELITLVHRAMTHPVPIADGFAGSFGPYLDRWYAALLRRNCTRYRPQLFNRRRSPGGDWYDPSAEEIATAIRPRDS
jgi:hypothetical protein